MLALKPEQTMERREQRGNLRSLTLDSAGLGLLALLFVLKLVQAVHH